jgi:hypothetical protein
MDHGTTSARTAHDIGVITNHRVSFHKSVSRVVEKTVYNSVRDLCITTQVIIYILAKRIRLTVGVRYILVKSLLRIYFRPNTTISAII